jgi:hypothetical protein
MAASPGRLVTDIGVVLTEVSCRACRLQLGIDNNADGTVRLEALFVLSITVGLRPGGLPQAHLGSR